MKEYPSMEEMIAECEKKRRDDEVIVFAFGVGRMMPMIGHTKSIKRGLDLIKKQKGFIGVHPIDLWHNLLVFDTLNNAKGARNTLKSKEIPTGNIAPILIPKMEGEQE